MIRVRQIRRERGAAAVEMALVLPVLLLVIGALVDLGRMFHAQLVLSSAAREGARMVSVDYSNADAITRMTAAARPVTLPTPTITRCPTSPGALDAARVVIQTPVSGTGAFKWTMLDFVPRLVGGSIPPPRITVEGSMTCIG